MTIDTAHRDRVVALADRIGDHSRTVIDRELTRLAGRAPGLDGNELDLVGNALDDIVESLLLARIRRMPARHATRLEQLFSAYEEIS